MAALQSIDQSLYSLQKSSKNEQRVQATMAHSRTGRALLQKSGAFSCPNGIHLPSLVFQQLPVGVQISAQSKSVAHPTLLWNSST